MPNQTPRLFLARHGETTWSLSGRHTSVTDIPLTANGEKRVKATGKALVGRDRDRLIWRGGLGGIFVSPRLRARRTLELLDIFEGRSEGEKVTERNVDVVVTEEVREWDYGVYEGLTSKEIQQQRKANGEGEWDIWRDGCPGGESPAQITTRLDALIAHIRTKYHAPAMMSSDTKRTDDDDPARQRSDVLIVAHGHILRALAMRWIGRGLGEGVGLLLEAGGIGTLSYEHNNINEPAILLGGAFMVDLEEGTR